MAFKNGISNAIGFLGQTIWQKLVTIVGWYIVAINLAGRYIAGNYNVVNPTCQLLIGHTVSVSSIYVLDEKRFVTGSGDNTVRLWKGRKCLFTLDGHSDSVRAVCACVFNKAECIVSGSHDRSIKIWNIDAGKCVKTLKGHDGCVTSVCVSRCGKWLISASLFELLMWKLDSNESEVVRKFECHTFGVRSVCVLDEKRFISGSFYKIIKVWNIDTGECEKTLEGHAGSVESVCVFGGDGNGKKIYSGSKDKTIKVWDAETGECERTLKGHTYDVLSVCVSGDGKWLVSGGGNIRFDDDANLHKFAELFVWNLESPDGSELVQKLGGHSSIVCSACFFGKDRILSGSCDTYIGVWKWSNRENYFND